MKATMQSTGGQYTAAQLRAAADIAEQLETLQAKYKALISDGIQAGTLPPSKTKRTMSPAARASIAAGQRARWEKQRKFVVVPAQIITPETPTETPVPVQDNLTSTPTTTPPNTANEVTA